MVTTPSNTTGRFCPRARFRRPRINLAMLVLIVIMTTVVHGGTSIGAHSNDPELHQPNNVSATPIEAVIFNGRVTINGETPAYSGFEITARIGDAWESYPVTVGADPNKPFEYANLGVAPPHELDLIGSEVEFWLEGQVKSSVKNYYAIVNEFTGEVCFECTFVFGIVRELDLDFPSLPDPTPTPIPTATNTPEPPPSPTSTATPSPSPIAPTATPPPTSTATPSPSPIAPTATPSPTSTAMPSPSPIAPTATPPPTSPAMPNPSPIAPTATPSPSPIPPTLTATATPSSSPLTSNLVPSPTSSPPTGIPTPLTNNPEPEDTGGGFNATLPLAIVLVLLLIGIAAYFGWQNSRKSNAEA